MHLERNRVRQLLIKNLLFFALVLRCSNSGAEAITLQDAVQSAYQNNTELKAQGYSVEAAKSQKQKAYGGFLPNLSADINNGTQKTKIANSTTLKGSANKKALNLSQDIFNGGSTVFDIKRANSVIDKEKAVKDSKEQEIILSTIQAYLNILRYQELLAIEEDNQQSQEKLLDHTKKKLAVRDATKSEVAKANADYVAAISGRVAAENNLYSAKNTFSKITGIPVNEISNLENVSDQDFHKKIGNLNPEALLDVALQNNPDIRAAASGADSARHQSSMTLSAMAPSVRVTLGTAEEKNPLYYSNQRYHNDSAYLNLHIPIFSSGVEYANISEANNILQREKYNLDSAKTKVRQQIVEYIAKVKNYYAQYESAKEQELANEIYVTTLKEEERLGTKSIIDLLRARQDLYSAKQSRINLHYDKITTIFSLKSLMGGLTYNMLSSGDVFDNFADKAVVAEKEVEKTNIMEEGDLKDIKPEPKVVTPKVTETFKIKKPQAVTAAPKKSFKFVSANPS